MPSMTLKARFLVDFCFKSYGGLVADNLQLYQEEAGLADMNDGKNGKEWSIGAKDNERM